MQNSTLHTKPHLPSIYKPTCNIDQTIGIGVLLLGLLRFFVSELDGSGVNSMTSNNGNGNGNITRWNPTKEQISILEGLYGEGMRTPTVDQIQIITSRLRAYGHIEGKNVFYWFQNHKARQRQKEKELQQQSCLTISYLDRRCLYFNNAPGLLYPPTTPSPPSSIDVFRPYYEPQNETAVDNCSLYPKVVLPYGSDRRLRVAYDESDPSEKAMTTTTTPFGCHHMVVTTATAALEGSEKSTLDLFPVLPTGIDQHDQRMITSADMDYNTGKRWGERPFFDFFSGNRCCGQD